MNDPYNYPFIQKGNTMYLSTISTSLIMNQQKMTSQLFLVLTGTHHSKKEISKEPYLRLSSLRTNQEATSVSLLM
jgi:hypothetical protein